MTKTEWDEEVLYIRRIKSGKTFGNFNNDPACFQRYVVMQKETAQRAGFHGVAEELQRVLVEIDSQIKAA